jgi:hypothetical protein
MALVQILKTMKAPKFNRQLHKGLSGYLDESEDLDRDASLDIYLFPLKLPLPEEFATQTCIEDPPAVIFGIPKCHG